MDSFNQVNPFARRESHSPASLIVYKIFTILSWLLFVVSAFYYNSNAPEDDVYKRRTIWGQNRAHPTPFALNSIIVSIYWIVLWISQLGYVWALFSSNAEHVKAAANVGSHFILHNLFSFAFVMLWVRSRFWLAELLLIVNFFNLSLLYFRHSAYPRFIHIPVVSGPLAWTFIAIYWDGAAMVNAHSLAARILANIAIWGILVYGAFYLVVFKDYTMGIELSILTAALGVGQFLTKTIAFQWIFAFTIMAALFVLSLIIALPGLGLRREGAVVSEDRERQPLLDDQ